MMRIKPSKPCHIWVQQILYILQNPVTSGVTLKGSPSKPCHIWDGKRAPTFKTLSHLGRAASRGLQNPVTSGLEATALPSKPCHIWANPVPPAFKTLSHLGRSSFVGPSKPCHIWVGLCQIFLQNPVTSGLHSSVGPSKPCHIWATALAATFKTLSHLGDYHKSFVVHRKFGIKSM